VLTFYAHSRWRISTGNKLLYGKVAPQTSCVTCAMLSHAIHALSKPCDHGLQARPAMRQQANFSCNPGPPSQACVDLNMTTNAILLGVAAKATNCGIARCR
jgi:hypothetical protein